MSLSINVRQLYEAGQPILFWKNRVDPFIIGSETPAQSGKVAIVRSETDSDSGKPMIVEFRLARRSHIYAWEDKADDNPFNTTSLASYFSTGHTVIFSINKPITYQNEVLRDDSCDIDQTIFDSGHSDYLKGFDLWRGILNLIIVT